MLLVLLLGALIALSVADLTMFSSRNTSRDGVGVVLGGQFFAQNAADSNTRRSWLEAAPVDFAPLNGLGRWISGGHVEPLGEGVFEAGSVLRMVRNGTRVYLVGSFQWTRCKVRQCSASDGSFSDRRVLRNIAVYDFATSTWSGAGLGCAGTIRDLVIAGDSIFVAGTISACFNDQGSSVNIVNAAQWNPTNGWSDIGGQGFDIDNAQLTSITRDPVSGNIFVAGSASPSPDAPDPTPYIFVKVLSGNQWMVGASIHQVEPNPPLMFNVVRYIAGSIYVGGSFQDTHNGEPVSNIMVIDTNGSPFSNMLSGVNGVVYDVVGLHDGTLLVGGNFDKAAGTVSAIDLALYNPTLTRWSSFHSFQTESMDTWQVWSLDKLSDGAVVASGYFQRVGPGNGTQVNNIAVFSAANGQWKSVGPSQSEAMLAPYTLSSVVFTDQHELLTFGTNGRNFDNILASYDETEGWVFEEQALLETGTVLCAAVSREHGIVVGGSFVSNGTGIVRSLAQWTGSALVAVGGGLTGRVYGISFLNESLYVVGTFRLPQANTSHSFGRFSFADNEWYFPPVPHHGAFLSFDPFVCVHVVSGGLVFVGGSFLFPADDDTKDALEMVAIFDAGNQTFLPALPGNWTTPSRVLAFADNSTHVFVVGSFGLSTVVGTFRNLACFDLAAWEWVDIGQACVEGSGCEKEAITTAAWADGKLFVGGNFTFIGAGRRTQVNNVAALQNGVWSGIDSGFQDNYVVSLAALDVVADDGSHSVSLVAVGPGLHKIFNKTHWEEFGASWSFAVNTPLVVVPFYFTTPFVSLPLTATSISLMVVLLLFVIGGMAVVVYSMHQRSQSKHLAEYSLLDVSTQVDDDSWLIDYDSLKIYNPPIGKGAYSVVNRAVLKGTVVAVKTYVGQDYYGDIQADFNREIAILTRLRHPNIILFIGACRTPLCIVTELAERGCLYDVIHTTPQEITWARIRSIALDSCRGMAYLHNQTPPLLHRDAKSANVLISESFVAKVSDFGIAKRLAIHTMTMRVGTTRWMAPEVLSNKGSMTAYSLGSDVYSFGVILWEMLTLQLPWGHVAFDHQIEDRVIAGEQLSVSNNVPMAYREILKDCFNFDAQLRPTFTELIGRVESVPQIEGSPVREVPNNNNP